MLGGIFAADAQTVSVGLTVGATPTNVLLPDVTTSDANNSPLVLGATVRLRTRAGPGLEVGAFRKNMDHRYAFGRAGLGFDTYYVEVSTWDVPVFAPIWTKLSALYAVSELWPFLSGVGPRDRKRSKLYAAHGNVYRDKSSSYKREA
jgi:hypothetical protein